MKYFCSKFALRYERKYITLLMVLIPLALILYISTSCEKNETSSPSLYLTSDTGFVNKDSVMGTGTNFRVQLNATFGGDVNITNIIIRNEHDGIVTNYFDTGVNNESIKISKVLTKGVYEKELWTFIAIDKNGGNASVSFTVTKDSNSVFGNIRFINATMGAQSSTLFGSFLSLNSGNTFFQDSAFLIQDSIEMLYYYDAVSGEENTIASANANIGSTIYAGTTSPLNWTVKNETRYYKTQLTLADFNLATNDSLLLVAFSEPNAKRKAKNLVAGDIYSFKTAFNKFGLFYVLQVLEQDTGSVRINILIQS
ncbi:MAG: hypothetical protein WCQ95_07645 [Bacteroidota bacterium]